MITIWKRHDYLSSLYDVKFDYQTTHLIESLKLDEELSSFIILTTFSSISFVIFLVEIIYKRRNSFKKSKTSNNLESNINTNDATTNQS